jgi:hypothetical protein
LVFDDGLYFIDRIPDRFRYRTDNPHRPRLPSGLIPPDLAYRFIRSVAAIFDPSPLSATTLVKHARWKFAFVLNLPGRCVSIPKAGDIHDQNGDLTPSAADGISFRSPAA